MRVLIRLHTGHADCADAGVNDAVYSVGFRVSSQGGLAVGDGIYVGLPGVSCANGGALVTVTDDTSGASGQVSCNELGGFGSPIAVGAGDHVTIGTPEVYAPGSPGTHVVQVSTAVDGTGESTYSLGVAENVSDVAASVSPAVAGVNDAVYSVGFRVSSQGGLAVGDGIYVGLPGVSCANPGALVTVTDDTSGASGQVSCNELGGFGSPIAVGAGDHVTIGTPEMYAPGSPGTHVVQVSTAVDGTGESTYSLGVAENVSDVAASVSPAVAGVNDAVYSVGFRVSSQGGLAVGDGIYVGLPGVSCANPGALVTVTDDTSGASGQVSCNELAGFGSPIAIGAGDHVTIATPEMYTPGNAGNQLVQVATAVDGNGETTYALSGATAVAAVSDVSASVTPAIAGEGYPTYTVGFRVSATGGLTAGVDTIGVGLPGIVGNGGNATITDDTTGATGSFYQGFLGEASPTGGSWFTTPITINPGDHVTITGTVGQTPDSTGPQAVWVATSKDSIATATYTDTSAVAAVSDVSASVTPAIAGEGYPTYTVGFRVSATGGLTAGVDTIGVGLPGIVGNGGNATITDDTTGATGSFYQGFLGEASPTGGNWFTTPITINPGDHVTITGTVGQTPDSTGPQAVWVATSKDSIATATYTDTSAVAAVSDVSASVTPAIAGEGYPTYTVGFRVSATGGLTAGVDTIGVGLPGIVGNGGNATITDDTTGATGSFYQGFLGEASPTGGSWFTTPITINPGDHVTITGTVGQTPDSTGPQAVWVATSKDSIATATYTDTSAVAAVSDVSASVTPAIAGEGYPTYTVGFRVSATGGLTAGVDTIGVGLPGIVGNGGNATITDDTTGATGSFYQGLLGEATPTGGNWFTTPITINPGDHVTITGTVGQTPDSAGTEPVWVATSKDSIATGSYTLTSPTGTVSDVIASVNPAVAGVADATYTVGFTVSSLGGLTAGVGTISVHLPGLVGNGGGQATITDTTTGATAQISNYGLGGSFTTPITINAGDHITITSAATLTTPDGVGAQAVWVSTSQDTAGT